MEAKDTVMEPMAIAEHAIVCWPALEPHEQESFQLVAKAQAEISFKAGYQQTLKEHEWDNNYYAGKQAGIRAVVDWINTNIADAFPYARDEWQAQLKVWGIE